MRSVHVAMVTVVVLLAIIAYLNLSMYQTNKSQPAIKSEIYFSDEPVLGEITELTMKLTSSENVDNVTAQIILPNELELINGNLSWNNNLIANQTIELRALVKVVKEGNLTVNTIVNDQSNTQITKNLTEITRTEVKNIGVSIVKYPPAPSWVVKRANNYMISLLGEDYFYNNITFVASFFKGPEHYAVEYRHPNISFIQVRLDSYGNVTKYIGPTKSYSFNLTEQQAIEIAKNYGLMEPIEAKIVYGSDGFQTDSGSIYENYMWHVSHSGGRSLPAGNLEIVYLDVDNGNVLGKLTYRNVKGVLPVDRLSELKITPPLSPKASLGEIINTSFKFSPWVNVSNLTVVLNFTEAFDIVNKTGNISNSSPNTIQWYGRIQAYDTIEINITLKTVKAGGYIIKMSATDYEWKASPQYSGPIDSAYIQKVVINPSESVPPYRCPNITSIDCMPAIPEEMHVYCEGDWAKWVRENCNNITFTS